jgi:peptidoglycan hydrolase-like protein with peptidoglycan-binding domain
MRLVFGSVHGHVPFALTHEAIEVQGTIVPYVAGQRVRVVFYSDGHEFAARTAAVGPHGKGTGVFRATVSSTQPGRVRAIASHVATPQLQQLQAGSEDMTVLSSPYLTIGSSGAAVWVLQRTLASLHYAVPQSGYFDEATSDAVVAFRKLTDLPRVGYADTGVFHALKRGEGAFHVRYPHQGSHVEANLTYQVLAEIEPGGRVRDIYPTSSGKPSTPTVLGQFTVYSKTAGENSEEMLDANYFIRGYAIHGYPEVPTYAASHGCLRVPNLDASPIYGWVQIGTPVDVYYASYGP